MFKLSIGLRLWANTSRALWMAGHQQWEGRECNGLASGIWPWHWLFIDQSLDCRSGKKSAWVSQIGSCSLRPVKKYKLCCTLLHWGLNLSHSGGTSDESHNLSSALPQPWDYLGDACLEVIFSFSKPFYSYRWFYGCFLGQRALRPSSLGRLLG